jgi:hypothetical protein
MNEILITDRKWLCQHRNGDTFATNPTTDFVSYFQILVAEKTKLVQTIEVSTVVEASFDVLITVEDIGGQIKVTHPFDTWASMGVSVGDSLYIEANGLNTTETVNAIQLNVMYITDTAFLNALSVSSGVARDDYIFRVTTVPTAVNFEFGIIPNSQTANNFNSLLNGEAQLYTVSGLVLSTPKAMTYQSSPASNLGSVQVEYTGASGTGSSVFSYTIEHIFRMPPFIENWLSNYQAGTIPTDFAGVNSFRYASKINFLTNPNNPNNKKFFEDSFQLGSVGFVGQNFNNGVADYSLDSISTTSFEVTQTNNLTASISRASGNFAAGVKVYLYVYKLPSAAEYSTQTNDFETNFVFDQLDVLEGAGASSSSIILNLDANINGGDPTLLDLSFDLDWNAAGVAINLVDGDNIAITAIVEDGTLTAELSDRMPVLLYAGPVSKDSDNLGITNNQIDFYGSSMNIALALPVSNVDTWNNRAYILSGSFRLVKDANSQNHILKSLEYRIVGRIPGTQTFFDIDTYKFPFPGKIALLNVGGTGYQALNIDTTRPVGNVPIDDDLRSVKLSSTIPGSFQNYQDFNWQLGIEIPHRTWIENLAVQQVAPEFYNSAEENDNFNQRTSNYSDALTYDIFIFATAVTLFNGIETTHQMSSDESLVKDFDVDAIGTGWSATTELFDTDGNTINTVYQGEDVDVKITFTRPAGALSSEQAEIVFEYVGEVGQTSRLSSYHDWSGPENALKPLEGETLVKITTPTLTSTVIECTIKGEFLLDGKPFNVYGHLVNGR